MTNKANKTEIISWNDLRKVPQDVLINQVNSQVEKISKELNKLIIANWKEGLDDTYINCMMDDYHYEALTKVVTTLKAKGYIVYGPTDHIDHFESANNYWVITVEFPKY
jgi:hypothetical protein